MSDALKKVIFILICLVLLGACSSASLTVGDAVQRRKSPFYDLPQISSEFEVKSLTGINRLVERFNEIDRIRKEMVDANIAFNAPKNMDLNDATSVQLKLGLNTSIGELKRLIEAEGPINGAVIKVSERMEARLSGQDFAITAITPEIQVVSRNEINTWLWEIKPRSSGLQRIHLTLSALVDVNGESAPFAIRTFDKRVNVQVTIGQQVGSFIKGNWQWLWAALLVPAAGWLWKMKTKKT